jgi:hypothetical protein
MSADTIPERSNGSAIDQTWFNIIRSVLGGDFLPRTDGVVTDEAGSVGSTLYRWLNAYFIGMYLYNPTGRSIRLTAPSSITTDYTLKLPPALPGSGNKLFMVNSSGEGSLTVEPDGSTLEISGTTLRVKDAGITRDKQASLGTIASSSSGGYSMNNSAAFEAVTNLTRTITTTGRPVFVGLISDGSGTATDCSNDNGSNYQVKFKRDSTQIALMLAGGAATPASSFEHIDYDAVAGTYTYTVEVRGGAGGTTFLSNVKLVVFEM